MRDNIFTTVSQKEHKLLFAKGPSQAPLQSQQSSAEQINYLSCYSSLLRGWLS